MIENQGSLDAASQRLMRAVETLEARLRERPEPVADTGGGEEAQRLSQEVRDLRERERLLEQAAAEASAALGRAAEQIRLAVEDEEEG
jgi:hypothetical protein